MKWPATVHVTHGTAGGHTVFEHTHAHGVCDGHNRRRDARRTRPVHTSGRAPPHSHTRAA